MAFLLLPMELKSGARNVRLVRRCAWFTYVFLVFTFIAYAAIVFWLAYRSRNVPAVSLDYKVELTQLPNIYICPVAFFSSYASTLPISSMAGSCNRYFPKQVPGPRATGLRTNFTRGSVNWALDNSERDASRTFRYTGDTDSDCEVEGVELPFPDFEQDDQNTTPGSSLCLRYNTSRFSFTPELIASTFSGISMSFSWTLPGTAPFDGYSRGANVFAAFSEDGVRRGEYDVPGSVISGGGTDGVELSLTVRKYLNGSEKVSGSIATTHQDYVASFDSLDSENEFPAYDYFSAMLTINPQGRLHIIEKSPINWTIILSQIVAGWSLVTAVFGIFFAYDLRREWAFPWPAHFKEIVAGDEELKGGSLETIPMRHMSRVPDLYPTSSSHV